MPKRVLSVGQCGPDNLTLAGFLKRHFDVEFREADHLDDTLQTLRDGAFDLVLVNRKLDRDYSDGIEIIKALQADPKLGEVPVMLVTNHVEHQDDAVRAGAARGFGKLEYAEPQTVERLREFLE